MRQFCNFHIVYVSTQKLVLYTDIGSNVCLVDGPKIFDVHVKERLKLEKSYRRMYQNLCGIPSASQPKFSAYLL